MPPRGESFQSPDLQEAMGEVRQMQQERVEAENPVGAETLQALSEVFSMQRERVKGEQMSPEQLEQSMGMMDSIVANVESRTDTLRAAEKASEKASKRAAERADKMDPKVWDLRLKIAKEIHELAESINTAEQLTFEAAVESQRAPEQIGLQMRMEASRDAQGSYEALAGQVYETLKGGKDLPQGHRVQLIEQGRRLIDLIKHEKQISELAERNFIDNLEAQVAEAEREAA